MDEINENETQSEVTRNEDGTVTVALPPPPDQVPEEVFNLVPFLVEQPEGKKVLKALAKRVVEEVTDDWESSEAMRERRRVRLKLLAGELDPKSFPFEDCANVHVPVMLERILRYVSRLYREIFPSRDYVFTAQVPGDVDRDRAEVVTQHSNHQIRKEIPDFFKQMRKAMMEFVCNGDPIVHSYYDAVTGRNRHEFLSPDEFVFPYVWKTTQVDMSDVPRKTRFLRKYKNELKRLEREGTYASVDRVVDTKNQPSWEYDELESGLSQLVDKIEGKDKPKDGKNAPYLLFEWHGWAVLPGAEDERPVVVTVEPRTQTVIGLYVREEDDPKDRMRFDRQAAELEGYHGELDEYEQIMARQQEVLARLSMPDVPPDEAALLQQGIMAQQPVAPSVPGFVERGEALPDEMIPGRFKAVPVRRRPIEQFSHGTCIDVPDSKSYGWGIGYLLEEFNKIANTAASQFTDSATLANAPAQIAHENVQFDAGETYLTPGTLHRVRGVSMDAVGNAIKVLQMPQANSQLLEVVNMALSAADGVSSAPEVLSGEPGKANETWRGISTRVEQAQMQIGFVGESFLEFLTNILRANARLNSVFLKDEELVSIVDPRTLESTNLKIGRDLYRDDFEIIFTADTTFSSKAEKVAGADEILGMVTSMPPEISGQMFPPSFVYEAIVRALKARGKHDMVAFLGPRPEIPQMRPEQMQPPPGAAPPGMPPGAPPPQGPPPGPPQGPPPAPEGPAQ